MELQEGVVMSPNMPLAMARNCWNVNQFQLRRQLYQGRTSRVFEAIDLVSGLPIALKLYRKHRLSALNMCQAEREVAIHIGLEHPNIIKLYAAFEDENNVYLVEEFAGGGDVFQLVKEGEGRFSESKTLQSIIIPLLNVLSYIHSEGIIHRDIKPENILVFAPNTVKLADFGLAIDTNEERPVTRTGTLDYMAPEVLACPDKKFPIENKHRADIAYNARVDVWAVGVLAYELMVGQAPFEAGNRLATYDAILHTEPLFPVWLSLPAVNFIKAALCKDHSKRATMEHLKRHCWLAPFLAPAVPSTSSAPPRRQATLERLHADCAQVPTDPVSMQMSTSAATFERDLNRAASCPLALERPVAGGTPVKGNYFLHLSSIVTKSLFGSGSSRAMAPGQSLSQSLSSPGHLTLAAVALSCARMPMTTRPSTPHAPASPKKSRSAPLLLDLNVSLRVETKPGEMRLASSPPTSPLPHQAAPGFSSRLAACLMPLRLQPRAASTATPSSSPRPMPIAEAANNSSKAASPALAPAQAHPAAQLSDFSAAADCPQPLSNLSLTGDCSKSAAGLAAGEKASSPLPSAHALSASSNLDYAVASEQQYRLDVDADDTRLPKLRQCGSSGMLCLAALCAYPATPKKLPLVKRC